MPWVKIHLFKQTANERKSLISLSQMVLPIRKISRKQQTVPLV